MPTTSNKSCPGVYLIFCLATGETYVGGTRNITRRRQQHRYDLRRGIHGSRKLQASWDRYGEDQFSFGTIVRCPEQDVLRLEQHFLDVLQPEYNTNKLAISSLGVVRDDEVRERLRRRPQSTAKRHEFQGEQLTAMEIAERTGLSLAGVRVRLRTGVPLDRPIQKGAAKFAVVGDGRKLTLRQIAQEFDLPLTTVYSRARLGWSGEALTQPRKHRGRNSAKGASHGKAAGQYQERLDAADTDDGGGRGRAGAGRHGRAARSGAQAQCRGAA